MRKSTIELPLELIDVGCVTECWSFNRLVIIKNSPFYEDWIATHYNLYVDSNFCFNFGEAFVDPPYYYDAILHRKQLHIFQISEESIVETIKTEIAMGNYILMYIKPYEDVEYYHEALFYGFDDATNSFLTVGLKDLFFQKIEYTYSYIKNNFSNVKQYFLDNHFFGNYLSLYYYYPMTAFRINENYTTEHCPFEAYSKLNNVLSGECQKMFKPATFGEYEETVIVYKGISCLYGFMQVLNKEINEENFAPEFSEVMKVAKKIQEHQKMILHSMRYLLQKWKVAMGNQSERCILEFNHCYQNVEKWLNMAIKYELTKDKALLIRIVKEIPGIFDEEKRILNTFLYDSIDWKCFNINMI